MGELSMAEVVRAGGAGGVRAGGWVGCPGFFFFGCSCRDFSLVRVWGITANNVAKHGGEFGSPVRADTSANREGDLAVRGCLDATHRTSDLDGVTVHVDLASATEHWG